MRSIVIADARCRQCDAALAAYVYRGAGARRKFCAACGEGRQAAVKAKGRAEYHRRSYARHGTSNRTRHRRECVICGASFETVDTRTVCCGSVCGRALNHARRSAAAAARRMRTCEACGKDFEPYRLNRRQREAGFVQRHCGCLAPARVERKPWDWKTKAIRQGGGWRGVDPFRVFERDGWRCHLCGDHAPKRLRGSTDDRAPEVDHIVPLSKGGEHRYENVATAHRGCNRRKGARPLGQPLLFG